MAKSYIAIIALFFSYTIRIWNFKKKNLINILEGHSEIISCILFTSNNTNIITSSWDSTIKVWNFKSGNLIKSLQSPKNGAIETLILTKRGVNKKQPNKNYDYVWNVIDNKTKFLLASINSGRSRKSKDAQKVFTEAYKQNGKIPFQIIVDGYKGYQDGCRKAFRNWGNERKVKFTSIKGQRKHIDN